MELSPTGWGIEITDADGGTYIRAVEKWSEKGEPLVGDEEAGRLVPAQKIAGFTKLVRLHHVVALMPAAPGWTLSARAFGGQAAFTTPIAGWALNNEGELWPVATIAASEEAGPQNPNPEGESWLQIATDTRYRIVPPPQ
jgi:hypothetical protein